MMDLQPKSAAHFQPERAAAVGEGFGGTTAFFLNADRGVPNRFATGIGHPAHKGGRREKEN